MKPEEHEEMIRSDLDYLDYLKDHRPHIWVSLKIISGVTATVMFVVSVYVSTGLPSDNVALDPHMASKVGLWVLTAILVAQFYVLSKFEGEQEKWAETVARQEQNVRTSERDRDRDYPPDTPDHADWPA